MTRGISGFDQVKNFFVFPPSISNDFLISIFKQKNQKRRRISNIWTRSRILPWLSRSSRMNLPPQFKITLQSSCILQRNRWKEVVKSFKHTKSQHQRTQFLLLHPQLLLLLESLDRQHLQTSKTSRSLQTNNKIISRDQTQFLLHLLRSFTLRCPRGKFHWIGSSCRARDLRPKPNRSFRGKARVYFTNVCVFSIPTF